MKILLINDYLTSFGGAEKIVHDTKILLEKKGHKVYLLGDLHGDEHLLSFLGRYFNLKYLLKTLILIKKEHIDIVHCHNISRNVSPAPLIASKLLRKKTILTIHDFHYYCPKTWGILENGEVCEEGFNSLCFLRNCENLKNSKKYILYHFLKWLKVGLHRFIIKRFVDIYICPSRKLREFMIKSLTLNPNKVFHLANFIDTTELSNPTFKEINSKSFLFVGRISKEKGVEVVINAFNTLVNKEGIMNITLLIIGDGPERATLEIMVRTLRLEKNIKFLGKIDNKDLAKYYQDSAGVIIPSICLENNPLVAIEGMKFGRPLIGSNVGGIPDLIEEGINGFLFKMANHIDLSKKILSIYGDENRIIRMGECGFNKVKREFNIEIFYEKLLELYQD